MLLVMNWTLASESMKPKGSKEDLFIYVEPCIPFLKLLPRDSLPRCPEISEGGKMKCMACRVALDTCQQSEVCDYS